MLLVGVCSVCESQSAGVRVCSNGHLVVLCYECEAVWRTPRADAPPAFPGHKAGSCTECDGSLWIEPAHWATEAEVRAAGWFDSVVAECGDQ
jgi:hypothetical protein